MKKLFFCLVATIAAFTAYSQEPLKGFTFDQFRQGEIVKKIGKSSMLLNYDQIYQRMIFAKGDECYYLGDVASVIYINIDGRIFVPVSGSEIFYEEIDLGGGNKLYVQTISQVAGTEKEKGGAYGSTGQSTASDQVSGFTVGRVGMAPDLNRSPLSRWIPSPDVQNLNVKNEGPQLVEKTLFYLKVNGAFKPILTKANLISALGHKKEINEFARQNDIDFKKLEDVKKMVGFAYSL